MFKKILGIWLYSSLCSMAFAQTSFEITGSIVDADTSEPLVGAAIIGEGIVAVSDMNGKFILKNVPGGTHIFKISHIGYAPEMLTVLASREMKEVVVELKKSTTELGEIKIVGKTKTREIKELPLVSQMVSEGFLKNNRENSLMQSLQKIPGVSSMNIGSGQSKPVIRGLGFNRLVVVQNGIKHEAQQWGSDHGLEIDQYGIENIRIIKGPASLLYGSDAIAGVIDVQPPAIPSPNSFSGEVNLLAESNNDLLGISAGIWARKEKWFYRGRLTLRDYADYKVPTAKISYGNYIFQLQENNLRNTAGNEANASFSIGYVSDNIKSETFFSNVYAKNGFFANAHGLEVRTSKIDYDHSNRDIDLPFHTVNHFKVTNSTSIDSGEHTFYFDLGYQHNNREEHSEPVPHGYMPKPPNSKEREYNKSTYSLNAKDVFEPNDKHTIVAGLNTEYQNNTIGGWGFLIPGYKRFTVGVFAYDHYEIQPDLHFRAGLRYDYGTINTQPYFDWYRSPVNNDDGTTSSIHLQRAQNKRLDFENISASAGLSYIKENITYKLNLGKSFRMPLAHELASDGVNYHMYRYERGNLDLDAEESYQLDISAAYSAPAFHIEISPFVNLFDNYIYLNPTPNYYETLQIYEYTQSKVFRTGGEISANTTLFENLLLSATGEYVYSVQTNGAKEGYALPFSPPFSGVFSASYQFKNLLFFDKPQIVADYRTTAAQNRIVPPEERTEAYQVLNLSFLTKVNIFKNAPPVEMRIKLNNIFDTKYYNHTSFYRLIDVPEAGRNISISLTIPFNNNH